MNWTDSKSIRYVAFSWLGGVLLALVPMMQARKIDWWTLGSSSIAALATILFRMAQPDVVAPQTLDAALGGTLNKNNTPTP